MNDTLVSLLSQALADVTIFYHRIHGFHWNVTGKDFPQWHSKFEEIYDDVYSSLDPIAENLRKIGVFAPFRLADLAKMASVADAPVASYDPATLVADLITTNAGVLVSLNDAFQTATQANQQGIANFIAERIDAHQKWAWQLKASL